MPTSPRNGSWPTESLRLRRTGLGEIQTDIAPPRPSSPAPSLPPTPRRMSTYHSIPAPLPELPKLPSTPPPEPPPDAPLASPPSLRQSTWGVRPRASIATVPLAELVQPPSSPVPGNEKMPELDLKQNPLSLSFTDLESTLEDHISYLTHRDSYLPFTSLAQWVQALSTRISQPQTEGATYGLMRAIVRFAAAITQHADFPACGWMSPRPERTELRYAVLNLMHHMKPFAEQACLCQVQWSELSQACADVRL